MKIFLGRHGETQHNIAEKPYFTGGSSEFDESLDDKGIETVKQLSKEMREYGINVLVYTDLKRSKETAEIIDQEIGGNTIMFETAGLREVNVGGFASKTREEIIQTSEEYRQALDDFLSGDITKIIFLAVKIIKPFARESGRVLKRYLINFPIRAELLSLDTGTLTKYFYL